jgi:hypothetical protein
VVGCVGLVADVRQVPARWRSGDRVVLAEAGDSLKEQAALIRFVWQSAALLSLAHDVSDGGLELALREAAEWSGEESDAAGDAPLGSIVLACPPENVEKLEWKHLRPLGAVR